MSISLSADANRLLDNGVTIVLFKGGMGSYTAFAIRNDHEDISIAMEDAEEDGHLTDDFTPEAAIKRLADKVTGVGDYADQS
jgi:hypothetical protein